MRIQYRISAVRDLAEIYRYIAEFDRTAAERVVRRIDFAIGRLAIAPNSGRPARRRGLRIMKVPSQPYVVVHRVMRDCVDIVGVMHTARRRSF